MRTNFYTYYDARAVIQRAALKEIEDALRTLGPVDVAQFPSGHKVWRVVGLGTVPVIEFDTKDDGFVRIEPSTECSLEPMLSDWKEISR